jgi:hypothetical protein
MFSRLFCWLSTATINHNNKHGQGAHLNHFGKMMSYLFDPLIALSPQLDTDHLSAKVSETSNALPAY